MADFSHHEIEPNVLLTTFDRISNGGGYPPGSNGCCDAIFSMRVHIATTGDPAQVQAAIDESYHYGNFIGQDLGVVYPVEVGAAICPDGTPFPVS